LVKFVAEHQRAAALRIDSSLQHDEADWLAMEANENGHPSEGKFLKKVSHSNRKK
jgi:hypothetical protein